MNPQAAVSITIQGSRPYQEDFVFSNQEKKIFAVADGFGGPSAGAEAAKAACHAVRGFLEREAGDLEATLPFVLKSYFSLAGNVLFNALIHANRKVRLLNKDKNVHEKGGASILAGFMDGDLFAIGNVGSCSSSLVRDGKRVELVIPRAFNRLCDPFSKKEAASLVDAPLMALGISEDLEPEITEYRVRRGDWIVMHTDGVTDKALDNLLALQGASLQASVAAEKAAELLRQQEYVDNASFLLLFF
jgi:serine/threonine protein phosphatase PrpC